MYCHFYLLGSISNIFVKLMYFEKICSEMWQFSSDTVIVNEIQLC